MRIVSIAGQRGLRWLAEVPETRRERMRGLLGQYGLEPDRALLLERARSVHTVGMAFPITVAFLDAELVVLDVVASKPGRILAPRRRVRSILELPAGADIRVGDRLRIDVHGERSREQSAERKEHQRRDEHESRDREPQDRS